MTYLLNTSILEGFQKAKDRIEAAAKGGWAGLATHDYLEFAGNGAVVRVLCKKCGRTINNRGSLMPDYSEEQIDFSDGSRHITPLCGSCGNGLTKLQLEAIYCADLMAMAVQSRESVPFIAQWAEREIVGHARYTP